MHSLNFKKYWQPLWRSFVSPRGDIIMPQTLQPLGATAATTRRRPRLLTWFNFNPSMDK